MSPSTPFVTADGRIDTDRVLAEAIPLAKLVVLVLAVALVPLLFVFAIGGSSPLGIVFVVLAQFVLVVGGGIVLMHVVVRAIRLAEA